MIALLRQYKTVATIAVLLAAFFAGWLANGWRLGGQIAEIRQDHETQLRLTAEANAAVILKQQADRLELERQLANLDQTSTERLTNAKQENDRLERLYADADGERRRLRIEVRVARNDATVSAATGSGSVGDAATVELSPAAGRAVWDLRRAMIEDREKLAYLQQWAREITKGN
ncbi:lysis protein [Stutzerimonas urumqiensis]|uniref:lysis system i-spanin subunit Rz n=1 Tax=Stutzerimonas urumqiensis TaxID=638269 RepID=UPI003DA402FC